MKVYILIVSFFLTFSTIGIPRISLFLTPHPIDQKVSDDLTEKLQRPHGAAKQIINGLHPINQGIFATYGGYQQVSNYNGYLNFPRKHSKDELYLLVTPGITPIPMLANTIHHWELNVGVPAKMYKYTRQLDEQTEVIYWNVEKVDLPEDNNIPLETVILIANPKNVYVPLGITPTWETKNLVLPEIFIKKGINILKNSLFMLNLLPYFSRVDTEYHKEKKRYSTLITN